MQSHKIHIFGGPGSGKTYIAAKLSVALGIPAFELDELYWDHAVGNYGTPRNGAERDAALRTVVERDSWIIEGVFHKWLSSSFRSADLILVLTAPVWRQRLARHRAFHEEKAGDRSREA